MGYRHPGRLFVARFGPPESAEDVLRFAAFLREEAGLNPEAPVDLAHIRAHFGIPAPKLKSLPNQQGLLINPEAGIIIINQDDPITRQRFTEGHEFMELLFAALNPGSGWAARTAPGFQHSTKERLCNDGAAELLMPRPAIRKLLSRYGMSYATAQYIAAEYVVSLTAAMVQMVRVGPGIHAIVLWQLKHKPTELRRHVPSDQLALFGDAARDLPPKRLRVAWSLSGPDSPYIPPDKSVPAASAIGRAWQTGVFVEGAEMLDLGSLSVMVYSESIPFDHGDDRQVLSLLHLPGDANCPHPTPQETVKGTMR